jgi:hypothetical protein
MISLGTLDRAIAALLGRVPTGVVIALVLMLAACRIAPILQQFAATLLALLSNNKERADRAERVLRTLRGLPDRPQNGKAPRMGGKGEHSAPAGQ